MANFQEIVRGISLRPLVREVGDTLAGEIAGMAEAHRRAAEPEAAEQAPISTEEYQSLLHLWSAVHGFASLEVFGHLDWLSPPARDDLFKAQVTLLARVVDSRRRAPVAID